MTYYKKQIENRESESWKILVDSDGYVVGFKDDVEKATQSE